MCDPYSDFVNFSTGFTVHELQTWDVLETRHLGSLTAANWVSFDFNVSCSSCWGSSLINTLKFKKKTRETNQKTIEGTLNLLLAIPNKKNRNCGRKCHKWSHIECDWYKTFFCFCLESRSEQLLPSSPLWIWSAEVLFQNFQIFHNILFGRAQPYGKTNRWVFKKKSSRWRFVRMLANNQFCWIWIFTLNTLTLLFSKNLMVQIQSFFCSSLSGKLADSLYPLQIWKQRKVVVNSRTTAWWWNILHVTSNIKWHLCRRFWEDSGSWGSRNVRIDFLIIPLEQPGLFSTIVQINLPLYFYFWALNPDYHALFSEKTRHSTGSGGRLCQTIVDK